MNKLLTSAALGAASVLAAGVMAAPASAAVTLCSSGPALADLGVGCTASGNDNLASVEAALAAATGVTVASLDLSLYGKSDDNPLLFSFSPNANPATGKTTDFTVLDGTLIKYVTVKGATSFKLYELAGLGASSGTGLSTLGILNGGGKQPDISHLSFWTVPSAGGVPEPATWAMMILGFGAVGGAMRGREVKTKVSFA